MPDELLDVIDETDAVLRQEPRSVIHARGLWHRGTHVFLFDSRGRLLIQKRSANRNQYASLLDCSVSEHVKAGESYLEAAQRGLLEEMGVDGIALQQLVKFKLNYGPNDNEISVVFEGKVDPAAVRFDPGEIESIQWLGLDELKTAVEERRSDFCGWFVEIMRWYREKPSGLIVMKS